MNSQLVKGLRKINQTISSMHHLIFTETVVSRNGELDKLALSSDNDQTTQIKQHDCSHYLWFVILSPVSLLTRPLLSFPLFPSLLCVLDASR